MRRVVDEIVRETIRLGWVITQNAMAVLSYFGSSQPCAMKSLTGYYRWLLALSVTQFISVSIQSVLSSRLPVLLYLWIDCKTLLNNWKINFRFNKRLNGPMRMESREPLAQSMVK
jgi:hypothetical protein